MASYLAAFVTGLEAAVVAAWPDVSAVEVYEGQAAATVPFERLGSLPYAVVVVPDPEPTEEWGITNRAFLTTVALYYVGDFAGDIGPIRAKAETMRDYLQANRVLGGGQRIERPRPAWSDEMEPNATFVTEGTGRRAGSCSATFLVGEPMP